MLRLCGGAKKKSKRAKNAEPTLQKSADDREPAEPEPASLSQPDDAEAWWSDERWQNINVGGVTNGLPNVESIWILKSALAISPIWCGCQAKCWQFDPTSGNPKAWQEWIPPTKEEQKLREEVATLNTLVNELKDKALTQAKKKKRRKVKNIAKLPCSK